MKKRIVSKVHIGNDVWSCGEINYNFILDGKRTSHLVIYGPDKKLWHLYGKDVEFMLGSDDYAAYESAGYRDFSLCRIVLQKLKIYILTHILDDSQNWCFDLTKIPDKGRLKVIYSNGTVKNIDFNGETFEDIKIWRRATWVTSTKIGWDRTVKPFAYRKF